MFTFQTVSSSNAMMILDDYARNLLIGYMPFDLIAGEVFRDVPTEVDTARLIKTVAPLTIESSIQLSGSQFGTVKLNFYSDDYYALSYKGLQAVLESYDAQQLGGWARAKNVVLKQLEAAVQIQREYTIASAITNPAIITQTFAPTYTWDDYANSDPVSDFAKARKIVVGGLGATSGCGKEANTAIMNYEVYNALRSNPQLVRAYFQTGLIPNSYQLSKDQLAAVMGVKRVLVGMARYNSAQMNLPLTLTTIWPNSCLFAHINESLTPDEAQQSLAYSFRPSAAAQGYADLAYEWTPPGLMPEMQRYMVRAKKYDDKLVDATCGCLITGIIA